jgi:predicted ATPase
LLLSFRVANFRSFYEEQELLLLPAYDKSRPAIPVAAIYGANASGKSNLLAAMEYMRTAVLGSFSRWSPDGGVPRDPFAFGAAAREEESGFGVDLLLDGEKYVYGFAVDDARITEEWLYHYPRGRRRALFEREADTFRFGNTLRGPKATIEEVTRPNSLFLSAAAQHGLEQIKSVYTWFRRGLQSMDHTDLVTKSANRQRTLEVLQSDSAVRSRFINLLRAADFGIIDVDIRDEVAGPPRDSRRRLSGLFEGLRRRGQRETDTAASDDVVELPSLKIDNIPAATETLSHAVDPEGIIDVVFSLIHDTPDGPTPLPWEKESNGTRTWFDFIVAVIDGLNLGRTLVVDELDTSLHPLLLRELVRLFQDEKTNPRGAQLIFTTHDTSLLARHKGEEGLRRDEVWFTGKQRTGETRLYPLTDFKPRQGLNWERRYLGGSVGAVPFLDSADFAGASDESDAAHG